MDVSPVLTLRGISKCFGSIIANKNVDFNLMPGEIHGLLGENGAGKSTLMNILSGLYRPDEGEIRYKEKPMIFKHPKDALRTGIGMVHQHFMLIPSFTVAENIVLGHEMTAAGSGIFLDMKKAVGHIRELAGRYGLHVDPDALIEDLPVGIQQRVEILKALYRNVDILILDEPTAVLTPHEVQELFHIMKQLVGHGVSIVFITHKLKEVMAISDRITVMRQGGVVDVLSPHVTDENHLAELMVGREMDLRVEKKPMNMGKTVLAVEHLTIGKDHQRPQVNNLSFQIRSGEILGIAGVQGNGQTELAYAMAGLQPVTSGTILLDDKIISTLHPRVLTKAGMGHIPEDRNKYGLVPSYTIADNQVLCTYYEPPFARCLIRNFRQIIHHSRGLISRFDIRAPGPKTPVGALSGGNQQKVILSRELSREIRFLLANQPTRGLDIGAMAYIHRQIIAMRDRGCGVLLISSELDEILTLSDRIAVMYDGEFIDVFDTGQVSKILLGRLMTSGRASNGYQ